MNQKVRFVIKAAVAHFVTYLICGMVFSTLFHYKTLFELGNAKYFMRDFYGNSSLLGPFAQFFRGLLIGGTLLILKDNLLKEKRAWLSLWILFASLGIVCTPAPAPVSIEGIIYSQLPLEFHLKTAPEILVQTLVFSIWVTSDFKWKMSEEIKVSAIVTAISGAGFSLGGILLTLALKADIMAGAGDPIAFVIMFIALAVTFFATKWYVKGKNSKLRIIIYYSVYYLVMAVLPTLYNYLTDSSLKSPLSLIFSGLPIIVTGIILSKINRSKMQALQGES